MKWLLLLISFLVQLAGYAQPAGFPGSWEGNWKGVLSWYKTGNPAPKMVNMELRIHRGDSKGNWSWQIIYGTEEEDNRPYQLIQKDSSGIHWVLDEKNGILLDQYWVASKFSGAFTVINSTIINSYWIENGQLMVEFYTLAAKPVTTSGNGNEESPVVDSYQVNGYQKAVLKRMQ